MKDLKKLLGPIAFYIGLLIALVAAVAVDPSGKLYGVLAILGIIVALCNITAEESEKFIMASVAFIIAAFGMHSMIEATGVHLADEIVNLATNITVLIGAGVVIIALKAIYQLAKTA
ncbi:MAG: hypothetical protein DSO02_00420 [Hadesarchaea archaeon]|nr:MAG: hypothetical protein DSO03_02285 [Hadesarchaea archaeon]TDA36463.1 MAG: hypothetical protein DSO02_00420 [Hadesarchaea archaeon]